MSGCAIDLLGFLFYLFVALKKNCFIIQTYIFPSYPKNPTIYDLFRSY
jgi:hypothetical protein